eukprot:CAMPEP_0117086068 /NCGR_PEP_ID=MMETSP0472-20121206/60445_1 /TAXON_ID=693140 ORGANISM="Tiarina fusus, Strain LIS" /NCGR_SAMPLE_ID=MMETSP0472 /ASSEMBLY_ACC=CAM_ASM_000603 /LENGTH=33 /DNA_ID= /DNA_START= /DNA_END= /DNA_ORIENTATION=
MAESKHLRQYGRHLIGKDDFLEPQSLKFDAIGP